jgi:hypothetical protein
VGAARHSADASVLAGDYGRPMIDTPPSIDARRRKAILDNLRLADIDRAHAMYADDAVLEFPQSGERFVGLENIKTWRAKYPADVRYRIRRMTGSGDLWVTELLVSYDGRPWTMGVSMVTFRGDRIAREVIYVAEPWDAAAWRDPWVTRFDREASVAVEAFAEDVPYGLEAELAGGR